MPRHLPSARPALTPLSREHFLKRGNPMADIQGPRVTPYTLPAHRLVRPTTLEFASLCGAIRTDMFPNTHANRYDYDAYGDPILDATLRDNYHALYEWTREYTFKRLVRETTRPRKGGAYEIHASPDDNDAPLVARRGRCVEADGSAPREAAVAEMEATAARARALAAGAEVAALITTWNVGAYSECEYRMQGLLEEREPAAAAAATASRLRARGWLDKVQASEELVCGIASVQEKPLVDLMDVRVLEEELAAGWLAE